MMLDRLKRHLEEFIETLIGRKLLYAYVYTAVVVSQSGSGEVEVLPDDKRIRGKGQATIILRHGMPGVNVVLTRSGQRLVIAFEGGNPDKPFVLSYDTGATHVDSINIDAQSKIYLGDTAATMEEAARNTDPIIAGHLLWEPAVPTIYYAPDVLGVPGAYTAVITNPNSPIPPIPATAGTALIGTITDGSGKVSIED